MNHLGKIVYSQKKVNLQYFPGLVGQLPNHDILVFVPSGCYSYISLFLNDDLIDKIMLYEVHTDRNQKSIRKAFTKNLKNKKCLIIDKSYTGDTLNRVSKLVEDEGGVPIKLALYPRSRKAVLESDYFLFLDQIIETKPSDYLEDNWAQILYKKNYVWVILC